MHISFANNRDGSINSNVLLYANLARSEELPQQNCLLRNNILLRRSESVKRQLTSWQAV